MRFTAAFLLLPLAACVMRDGAAVEAASAPAPAEVPTPAAETRIVYPETQRGDVVETQFGEAIADPYRWLENDVRQDPAVRQWVTAQNDVTERYLATLPARQAFRQRMTQIYNFERYGIPEKRGDRIFYTRNSGLQNQSVLVYQQGANGAPLQLIDPNTWSADGATALAEWEPSDDGRRIVYTVQEGGTDWRVVRVLDVDSRQVLPDELRWVKFSGLAWAPDGSGFYYSRFPEPEAARQFQSTNERQAVYFHRIGTPQSQDRLIFSQPDRPSLSNTAEVSDDGRWLIVTSSEGTDARYDVTLIDRTRANAQPRRFITGLANDWTYIGNAGTRFYWRTNNGGQRQRIVVTDVARPDLQIQEIVAEDAATLSDASIVGNQLIASYLVDAQTEVRTYDLNGRRLGRIELGGIGTAGGFSGHAGEPETFYSFASYNRPATIYRYDSRTGRTAPFAQPQLSFDPEQFTVRQVFYNSKDGTRIPMFIMHRRDMDMSRPHPTLLYGYGGFDIAQVPAFQPRWLTWVDMGGVLAVANLRGGGEYGEAWHDAGRRANKQNVFDDFIAAAEYLIAQNVTTSRQLAIEGRSNGGLLVGAVVNQRPDLFAAALPGVGVMDMLRFNRFTAGRYWTDDYGFPDREADFRILRAYSPYHNIRSGVRYPAILATTADTDDRVVPGHSFKYIAALQAADTGPMPKLIRIETRAGHGSGKPTEMQIEEYGDMYAFIAHFTGLEPRQ